MTASEASGVLYGYPIRCSSRVNVVINLRHDPRNRVAGAEVSEHGRANAIDIRAFILTNGKRFGLTDPEAKKTVREAVKASACGRFMTVLGPGSDGYHEEHIHLDLAERSNGFKLCHWEVNLPVPLPRPRPPEASAHAAAE